MKVKSINFEILNEKLRYLYNIEGSEVVEKGEDPEAYEKFKIHKLDENLYVKAFYSENSYSGYDEIIGLQIVTPTAVTVTNFEPIK